jgi:hypothetical protein
MRQIHNNNNNNNNNNHNHNHNHNDNKTKSHTQSGRSYLLKRSVSILFYDWIVVVVVVAEEISQMM